MYNFGERGARKQIQPKESMIVEYMVLGSEPVETNADHVHKPSFTYTNRYMSKRRVMRTIKRLRASR